MPFHHGVMNGGQVFGQNAQYLVNGKLKYDLLLFFADIV
jgi:hypothetical protein